jgi:hypothetical protein
MIKVLKTALCIYLTIIDNFNQRKNKLWSRKTILKLNKLQKVLINYKFLPFTYIFPHKYYQIITIQ